MTLASSRPLVEAARAGGYAVAGFAAYNLETLKTLLGTADRLRAPLIVQTTGGTIDHFGLRYLAALVRILAEEVSIPVALHLDHGSSIQRVQRCLDAGYTSIMVDGSRLPYPDNVSFVQEAVRLAHTRSVPVEAELGRIGGVEDDVSVDERDAFYTDPDEAADFVRQTGCDFLAVAIGTAHGMYRGIPQLDFDRLDAIQARVSVPLVLHGASGLPGDAVREAVRRGMAKINFASELKEAFGEALRAYLIAHPDDNDPRHYFPVAERAYAEMVEAKIRLAGAAGRV